MNSKHCNKPNICEIKNHWKISTTGYWVNELHEEDNMFWVNIGWVSPLLCRDKSQLQKTVANSALVKSWLFPN